MSRLLGDTLPDDLVAELDGTGLAGKVGQAYLLVVGCVGRLWRKDPL